MCEGKYVGRDEITNVPTPVGTDSWHPVAHADVIDAVSEVVKANVTKSSIMASSSLFCFGERCASSHLARR